MKRGKISKIQFGGFELLCLILFAWPLLALLLVWLQFFSNEPLRKILSSGLFLVLLSYGLIYAITLIYNLKNPFVWIKMETKKRWKVCALFSVIGIGIQSLLFPSLLTVSPFSMIISFILGFISAFLFLTGANTFVLWLQGKGTFTSKKEK